MLYDRMCKKIFRVDGMLLLLLCIVCKVHRSGRFVYLTRKIEKIPLKQPDVCLNSRWNAIRCLYTKNCILLFILSYSIFRKKTIKSEASYFISVYFCISWIRDWNRWNSNMSRICYVFQNSSNELEKSCNMIFVVVYC